MLAFIKSRTLILLCVAGAAVHAASEFGINIGEKDVAGNVVAWVAGESRCVIVDVAALNTNPCGHSFNLNGQTGFMLEGCGTADMWINQNHQFWANCGSFSQPDNTDCAVHTSYHCE
ncbi:hypothetical protein C8J56DRAFT_783784 [Mycena floridula]|nr:hypothetical protein C8J56DRAFT_783784 [Mycena floridula]